MTTFTVVGLIDSDSGVFLPAGVFAGHLASAGNDTDTAGYRRCVFTVEATNWRAAERRALAEAGTKEVFADNLEPGHVLRYDDGTTAEIDEVNPDVDDEDELPDEDEVVLRFPDDDRAVKEGSALVRVVV
jgi:hypothetical protein